VQQIPDQCFCIKVQVGGELEVALPDRFDAAS
jgi:hypothetical protein